MLLRAPWGSCFRSSRVSNGIPPELRSHAGDLHKLHPKDVGRGSFGADASGCPRFHSSHRRNRWNLCYLWGSARQRRTSTRLASCTPLWPAACARQRPRTTLWAKNVPPPNGRSVPETPGHERGTPLEHSLVLRMPSGGRVSSRNVCLIG